MTAKITALIVTMIVNIVFGVVVLFGLIVLMNGLSENDASWGLGFFILVSGVVTISTSLGSFFLTGKLIKKKFSSAASALISIPVFSICGICILTVSGIIGIGVAEFARKGF